MTKAEKMQHCKGCHDDYYNDPANTFYEGKCCWSLERMELIQRKEVSVDQRPPWQQKAKLFPSCYHRPRYVYVGAHQTR